MTVEPLAASTSETAKLRETGEPLLQTENLTIRFGGLTALDNVSVAVARGQVRAIIGPNGAGKSTFFNCVTGVLRPSSGRVLLNGNDIAGAMATDPQLLCLDEPTAGMSAAETRETVALVRRIAEHLTILIVEHDMEVVMGLANRITVLHYGRVLAEGTPAEIQQNPRVLEVYLKT